MFLKMMYLKLLCLQQILFYSCVLIVDKFVNSLQSILIVVDCKEPLDFFSLFGRYIVKFALLTSKRNHVHVVDTVRVFLPKCPLAYNRQRPLQYGRTTHCPLTTVRSRFSMDELQIVLLQPLEAALVRTNYKLSSYNRQKPLQYGRTTNYPLTTVRSRFSADELQIIRGEE